MILFVECQICRHYKCILLPAYQIHMYVSAQRKYTCKNCVNFPEDVQPHYFDHYYCVSLLIQSLKKSQKTKQTC